MEKIVCYTFGQGLLAARSFGEELLAFWNLQPGQLTVLELIKGY